MSPEELGELKIDAEYFSGFFFNRFWKDFSSTMMEYCEIFNSYISEEERLTLENLGNEVANIQHNLRGLVIDQEVKNELSEVLFEWYYSAFTSSLTIDQRTSNLDAMAKMKEIAISDLRVFPKIMSEISCYFAFEKLYQSYREKLRAYVIKFFYQCRDSADDIIQEVFVAAIQQARKTKIDKLEAYIFRIAYNKAVDLDGKRKQLDARRPEEEFLPDLVYEPSILDHLERDETRELVRSALKSLPELQWKAVELRYYEDLSLEQIAQILDCPVSTVKSRLRYALDKLGRNPRILKIRE